MGETKDREPTGPEVLIRGKLPPWLGKEIPLKRFRLVPYETGHQTPASALIVYSSPEHPEPQGRVIVSDNRTLLELACDILGKLDPVTNEQILARIRKLLEDQG